MMIGQQYIASNSFVHKIWASWLSNAKPFYWILATCMFLLIAGACLIMRSGNGCEEAKAIDQLRKNLSQNLKIKDNLPNQLGSLVDLTQSQCGGKASPEATSEASPGSCKKA